MTRETRQEVHLSHSQVAEFTQCPKRYHLHRRLGLEPEFCPSGLLFGSAIHEALALHNQQRLEGKDATLEALYGAFNQRWDEEQLPVMFRPKESEESLKRLAKKMLEFYLDNADCSREVLAVEEPFRFLLSENLPPIHGVIDLVELKPNGGLVVSDFKTAKNRREPDGDQLVLYREAVRTLGYPGNSKLRAQYTVLLKTKQPDIVIYEPEIGPRDVEKLRVMYEEVWQAIQSGWSYARPDWWCATCQWGKYCDAR